MFLISCGGLFVYFYDFLGFAFKKSFMLKVNLGATVLHRAPQMPTGTSRGPQGTTVLHRAWGAKADFYFCSEYVMIAVMGCCFDCFWLSYVKSISFEHLSPVQSSTEPGELNQIFIFVWIMLWFLWWVVALIVLALFHLLSQFPSNTRHHCKSSSSTCKGLIESHRLQYGVYMYIVTDARSCIASDAHLTFKPW